MNSGTYSVKKIPTLFKRDATNMALVTRDIHPDCQWVIDGEGVPMRKLDGMCCAVRDGVFVKRREIKKGATPPADFIFEGHDDVTGKSVGWVPVGDGPDDKFFREAMNWYRGPYGDLTFELVGPKSQGGIEGYARHVLVPHDSEALAVAAALIGPVPRDFDGLSEWLKDKPIEGIVWHHPDGRMAKIKGRDFGYKRVPAAA